MNKKAVIGISVLALVLVSVLAVTVLSEMLAVQKANSQPENSEKVFDCSFNIWLGGYEKIEVIEGQPRMNETTIVYRENEIGIYNNGNNVIPSGLKWNLTVESEGYYYATSGVITEAVETDPEQTGWKNHVVLTTDLEIKVIHEIGYHVGNSAKVVYTLTVAGIGTETKEFYL